MDNGIKYSSLDLDNIKYFVLDYVQSESGAQYINTGFVPTKTTKVDCTFQYTSTTTAYGTKDTALFGTGISGQANTLLYFANTTNGFQFSFGSENSLYKTFDLNKHTVSFAQTVYFDDVLLGTLNVSSYTNANNLWLFRSSQTNMVSGASAKIYNAQIYDNQTLVRDFIPAIQRSDSSFGLYDKVNDKFYANAGTGTFGIGNIIGIIK